MVKFLSDSLNINEINLSGCSLGKKDADLFYYNFHEDRKVDKGFNSTIKILNLSKNKFGKKGARVIANYLKKYQKVEALDLSFNAIGCSGAQALSEGLANDQSMKYMNLYGNIMDVEGSKHLSKLFSVHSKLEFLDLGYNRLRDKGLEMIVNSMVNNVNCKISTLGLKFNFITEGGTIKMLEKFQNSDMNVKKLYLKNNKINTFGLKKLHLEYQRLKCNIFIDLFDKFKYLDEKKL